MINWCSQEIAPLLGTLGTVQWNVHSVDDGFGSELCVAIASVIISLCALGLTLWQACITRKHNKLSVRPFLTTLEHHGSRDDVGAVVFELENCGVGPAIIKNIILLDGDKEICRNNRTKFDSFLREKAKGCSNVYTGFFVPGSAFAENVKHPVFSFNYALKTQNISFIHTLNLIVEYQSIYEDEIFIYDSRKDRVFHGRENQNE